MRSAIFLPKMNAVRFVLVFSLVLVVCYNFSTWRALNQLVPLNGFGSIVFFASFALFLWAAFNILLGLFISRWTLKPILMLLVIPSSVTAYFMNTYGVSIDAAMIQNLFETNPAEATALLSAKLVVYLVFLGLIPCVAIWKWPIEYLTIKKSLKHYALVFVGSLLLMLSMVAIFYSTYASILRDEDKLIHFINPTNYLHALHKYTKQSFSIRENNIVQVIADDAKMNDALKNNSRKSLMVIVVGETARADHFSLNGYQRETNPELKNQSNLLNFTQVQSCGTSTAISVPCMFSMFDREHYSNKKGKTYESLLDVLQRSGLDVLWLDNNSDCKGTCLRVPNQNIALDRTSPFCDGTRCLDEVLIDDVKNFISTLNNHAVLVLHSAGSHGPAYYERYPIDKEVFKPACHTNQLGSCSLDELVNVYDNTILYTDYFLAKVIKTLAEERPDLDRSFWYVSDHGESLGEHGLYLHAAPYSIAPDSQTHVPMMLWFSDNALKNQSIDEQCLARQQSQSLSHDNLFHSVLGYFQISSKVYQASSDIFNQCRKTGSL